MVSGENEVEVSASHSREGEIVVAKKQMPRGWWGGPEGTEYRRRHGAGELTAREVADQIKAKHGFAMTVGAVHKAYAKWKGKGVSSRRQPRSPTSGSIDIVGKVLAFIEDIAGASIEERLRATSEELAQERSRNIELEEELRNALQGRRDVEQSIEAMKVRLGAYAEKAGITAKHGD